MNAIRQVRLKLCHNWQRWIFSFLFHAFIFYCWYLCKISTRSLNIYMTKTTEYWSALSLIQNERGTDDPETKCFLSTCFSGEFLLDCCSLHDSKFESMNDTEKKRHKLAVNERYSASYFLQTQVRQGICWNTEAVWNSSCYSKKAPAKYLIKFFLYMSFSV